ncbi:MAG: thioredoxin [Acidimicrobiales bacterium]|nr:thioredoxin [Acidimicrobiales bacterium]
MRRPSAAVEHDADAPHGVISCHVCGRRNRVPVAARGRPRCGECHTDLPWLVDADSTSFPGAIDAPGVVLVDFWAPWCGPCRMVSPILETLAQRYAGELKVVKVNVDNSPELGARYDAQGIPLLVVLRDGAVVQRVVGAQPEHRLDDLVQSVLRA